VAEQCPEPNPERLNDHVLLFNALLAKPMLGYPDDGGQFANAGATYDEARFIADQLTARKPTLGETLSSYS
jgi:hypothetical protein